jgi:hypothetical protein
MRAVFYRSARVTEHALSARREASRRVAAHESKTRSASRATSGARRGTERRRVRGISRTLPSPDAAVDKNDGLSRKYYPYCTQYYAAGGPESTCEDCSGPARGLSTLFTGLQYSTSGDTIACARPGGASRNQSEGSDAGVFPPGPRIRVLARPV